jgi:nitroimidazol reductase NimA-like FMN-containing flavoprotein (pyridoxamine 5'-phosphate oxidase superfamily)
MDGFVSLSAEECLRVLRSQRVARVAVSHHALPAIASVGYVMDGSAPVFRARRGSVLARACLNAVVAFAVDDSPAGNTNGTSVLIVGMANAVTDSPRLRALGFAVQSDTEGRDVFLTIADGTIAGHREQSPDSVSTAGV